MNESSDLDNPSESRGESRWPMAIAVALVITLQFAVPDRNIVKPGIIVPIVEGILLVILIFEDPGRINRASTHIRRLSIALIVVITVDMVLASIDLIYGILEGEKKLTAGVLLGTGAAIWFTSVLAFSLWYWQLDRGGPAARALGHESSPSFMFPEMQNPEFIGPGWMPEFVDYLFLAFTNAAAFSPTDTLPLKHWAKLMMLFQSALSLVVGIVIIAYSINAL